MKTIETRIQKAYESMNPDYIREGHEWYENAHRTIKNYSEDLRVDQQTFSAVVSILSPFNPWERNIDDASKLIFAVQYEPDTLDKLTFTTFKNNVNKAVKFIRNEVSLKPKGAMKTYSFAKNLLLNPNYVTIDSHMLKYVDLERDFGTKSLTDKTYSAYADVFKKVSKKYLIHGYQLQASLWLHARNEM